MGMATVSGLVSGFWRAGAAAAPLHQFCCCPCTAARGMHYYYFFPARRQLCRAGGPGKAEMQSGLAARMITDANSIIEVPVQLNWLRKTGSGRQFYHSVSHRRDVRFSRELVASGNGGGGDGGDMGQEAAHVRGMASSKRKEQPRGSLWRTRSVISKETVQAVYDLKRNKDSPVELAKIFQTRIPRLLKMDLLATLAELQRQNEIELALRIFDVVRKEIWYKPDQFLYREMLDALGRNRRIVELETKFQELQDEGIKPEVPVYRELVGAYVRAHMLPEALKVHAQMVESGCGDDPLSLQFIETGREKEAVRIKQRRKAAEKLDEAEQKEEESRPSEVRS